MYVKIVPIKAPSSPRKTGSGCSAGVKKCYLYITDENKVSRVIIDGQNRVNEEEIDTQQQFGMSAEEYFFENETDINRVSEYIQNSEKIKRKWVSGYYCQPETAMEEFELVKTENARRQGIDFMDKVSKGNQAYHIIQSFDDDLNLSDEEVHRCGIELCKKLGCYQAVIASHVHPLIDENGEVHGKQKHNHILMNADCFDPEKQFGPNAKKYKYHACKESYAQLKRDNDDIAKTHNLPFIEPDGKKKSYSWTEAKAYNKGCSWKERVRTDIDKAKRVSRNWPAFEVEMSKLGYTLKEGVHVTYICPAEPGEDRQKRVRDSTLGEEYTKEKLMSYWKKLRQVQVEFGKDTSPTSAVLNGDSAQQFVARYDHQLYLKIPKKYKYKDSEYNMYLEIDSDIPLRDVVKRAYIEPERSYEICDRHRDTVAVLTGEQIDNFYRDAVTLQSTVKKRKRKNNRAVKNRHKGAYYNPAWINYRTGKPYAIRLYDETGRERSNLELAFILACVIIRREAPAKAAGVVFGTAKNPIYAATDYKLQAMADALAQARENKISSVSELDKQLKSVGIKLSRIKKNIAKNDSMLDKMDVLESVLKRVEELNPETERIFGMPEGEEKRKAIAENKDVLKEYKQLKAYLYRNRLTQPEQISDFRTRHEEALKKREELSEKSKQTKQQYRTLKKLEYSINLANNKAYLYGTEQIQVPEQVVLPEPENMAKDSRTKENSLPEQEKE